MIKLFRRLLILVVEKQLNATMKKLLSAIFTCLILTSTLSAQSTATYSFTFESTWSQGTHPIDWPGASAHYSGIFGGTHNSSGVYWTPGQAASLGVKLVAEAGSGGTFRNEVASSPHSDKGLGLPGIALSPGQITHLFDVDENFSLVTLISMIAPSPDWFVGVSGLDLHPGSEWESEVVVDLIAWDSGTDSGTTYRSPNQTTTPTSVITRLRDIGDGNPLAGDDIVGTFTFTLESSLPVEITSFDYEIADRELTFNWETATEENNLGFEIEHSLNGIDGWQERGFVNGAGHSSSNLQYSFQMPSPEGGSHYYRLSSIDFDGTINISSILSVDIPLGASLVLSDPYPNPTKSSFNLVLSSSMSGEVNVLLYDPMGRLVGQVYEGGLVAGKSQEAVVSTDHLPRGLYIIQMQSERGSVSKRVLVQ